MRDIAVTMQTGEVSLPLCRQAVGIDQILFVEIFDECGIAAGKLGGLEELFDQTFHGIGLIEELLSAPSRPNLRWSQTSNYNRVCPI